MKKIRVYTSYSYEHKIRYYIDFEIVKELPKVGDRDYGRKGDEIIAITSVSLDCEQGNDDVWDYDYYEIATIYKYDDGETEDESHFVAIEKGGD